MQEVQLWLNAAPVGLLVASTATEWTVVPSAPRKRDEPRVSRLSVRCPAAGEEWRDSSVRRWFQHLLPEPGTRLPLHRRLGISSGNDFALLAAQGADCPGAVNFSAPGKRLPVPTRVRALSSGDLREVASRLAERRVPAADATSDYLLPGERPKLPIHLKGDTLAVAEPGHSGGSTHILKAGDYALPDLVLNEWFCMHLARLAGLQVCDVTVRKELPNLLLVTRIDRAVDTAGRVSNIHMEDFCQALGTEPAEKFQREGGPSVVDCAFVIRRHSAVPALDLREFLRWVLFVYLVGCGVSHGKQLVLLHTHVGVRLGPFFGIWSSHVYPGMNDRMAMTIGQEDRPDWLIASRWREFARQLGVRPAYVLGLLRTLAKEVPDLLPRVRESAAQALPPSKVLDEIQALIRRRCRQALVSMVAESA